MNNIPFFQTYSIPDPIMAPCLSNDNMFLSNPEGGKLQYTTPSLMTLFGVSQDTL